MNLAVQKNHLGVQILYRIPNPVKKSLGKVDYKIRKSHWSNPLIVIGQFSDDNKWI